MHTGSERVYSSHYKTYYQLGGSRAHITHLSQIPIDFPTKTRVIREYNSNNYYYGIEYWPDHALRYVVKSKIPYSGKGVKKTAKGYSLGPSKRHGKEGEKALNLA